MRRGDRRLSHKSHSRACKERIKKAMLEDEGDRAKVEAAEERINEHLEGQVAKHAREDEERSKKRRVTFEGEPRSSSGSLGSGPARQPTEQQMSNQGGGLMDKTQDQEQPSVDRRRARDPEENEEERN